MNACLARLFTAALVLLTLAGCRVARPSELPLEPDWMVVVKSARMPDGEPDVTHFAHHSWVDVKFGDENSWERVEVLSETSGVRRFKIGASAARADRRWQNRDVRVLETIAGDDARTVAERIRTLSGELASKYKADYLAWPGPNSNTLLAELARGTPQLSFPLHHNAVGKDYPGWIDAGLTTSKTGVHFDILPLGFALGLREGIELHVLQLTFGISFWPPRLELPFLPEIPWSKDVDAPYVEVPRGDQFIVLLDTAWMTMDVGPEGLPEKSSWLIEYASADAWHWIEYEWIAPADGTGQGSLRVHERSSSAPETGGVARVLEWDPNGTVLYDADFEGRHVKIVLRRLESGRFMPDVKLSGP